MKESTRIQHEKDVKNFNETKQKSIEELNKELNSFLKVKGLDSKYSVVIINNEE